MTEHMYYYEAKFLDGEKTEGLCGATIDMFKDEESAIMEIAQVIEMQKEKMLVDLQIWKVMD